jgi:ADP-ribose pyrophosphatase YjhB (NUDIX family)
MGRESIGVKAFCVAERFGAILVSHCVDPHTGEQYYRPLGGTVEYGERTQDTVVREFRNELGVELTDLERLGTLENIFEYGNAIAHELVTIYDGTLTDESLYSAEKIQGFEAESESRFEAVWKPLADFEAGDGPLYPDGLLDLLVERFDPVPVLGR